MRIVGPSGNTSQIVGLAIGEDRCDWPKAAIGTLLATVCNIAAALR